MFPSKPASIPITNRSFLSGPLQHATVVAILFLFSNGGLLARDWVKISSPKAEVYSNAGAAPARQALEQLHWMTDAFQAVSRRKVSVPLRILIFASEKEFAEYRPTPISTGFYQSGPAGDWICFLQGDSRVAPHEYTHSLLNRSTTQLPQWLEEGLAEFFSTLRIDNKDIVIGSTIPGHVANLRMLGFLPQAELVSGTRRSIHEEGAVAAARFYASSWALVHMLYFAPRFASRMPAFVEAIDRAKTPPEQAFAETFGMTVGQALGEAKSYLQQAILPSGKVMRQDDDLALPISAPKPVDAVEIAQVQAELLLDSGRRDQAVAKYRQIAKSNSRSSLTAQAYWALSENDLAAAGQAFAKLAEDPQAEARVVFEYAMLLRDRGSASRGQVTALLRRVVNQNRQHPEAHFLLGVRATDEKRYSDAVEHLREAVTILPRQSSFWHALGYAQSKAGNLPEARNAAYKAVRLAGTEQEEKMARDLLTSVEAPDRGQPSRRVDVPVSEAWKNPQGDASITGTLKSFVCSEPVQLELTTGAGLEKFVILQPKKLVLRNAGNSERTFSCGVLEPVKVRIEYHRATRDITSIDFAP